MCNSGDTSMTGSKNGQNNGPTVRLLSSRPLCGSLLLVLPLVVSLAQSVATKTNATTEHSLKSVAPSIRHDTFGEFAEVLLSAGIVQIHSSNARVTRTRLAPICDKSHDLKMSEFLETIARQTGTTAKFDEKKCRWNFEPPAMPLPYRLSIAKGWHEEQRGYYTAYIPKIAPVGMDVYMMGRFDELDDSRMKQIRNEQALWFADRMRPGVKIEAMNTTTVDGCEALSFETKAPMEGRQWRQWAFVKDNQAFVIVSAVDDKNESKLIPDVEAMVSSFRVIEPVSPFP